MDRIIIKGGKKLTGEITISGAKNSVLPILFATLLTDEPTTITNVPSLIDVEIAISLLNFIGKKTIKYGNIVKTYISNKYKYTLPYELVQKMRASILAVGPLLARIRKIKISFPGGCAIGARPIDMHLKAFTSLGVKILNIDRNFIKIYAEKELLGTNINLRFPSVGTTENILLASVLAKGNTTINNAACEPEIVDLITVLNKMGARIIGAGTKKIHIVGVSKLRGFCHKIIPDRVEAATYILAAAITKGEIVIKETIPKHLRVINNKLRKSGLHIKEYENTIHVKWIKNLIPQNITTNVYPGFPTDIQAQWMVLMCLLNGNTRIEEKIFENRFLHVSALRRFGANILTKGNTVYIKGVKKFLGTSVSVSDLRAGAALILAGLAAEGETIISKIEHIYRGYDTIEKKLEKLNATIKKIR
jgi:UDP-N-acetylglucosamine 1-carboxyvinyltransferase